MSDTDQAQDRIQLLEDVLTEDEQQVIRMVAEDGMTPQRLAGRLLARALHDPTDE